MHAEFVNGFQKKEKAYNSPKVCEVNYARVQGLEANIEVAFFFWSGRFPLPSLSLLLISIATSFSLPFTTTR